MAVLHLANWSQFPISHMSPVWNARWALQVFSYSFYRIELETQPGDEKEKENMMQHTPKGRKEESLLIGCVTF